jgi:hypothetical protein
MICLSEGLSQRKTSLLTLRWTLAFFGQSLRPLQGVHTSHLRTLSKINYLQLFLQVAPRRFVPGEPPILHRSFGPSTPTSNLFSCRVAVLKISSGGGRILGTTPLFGKHFREVFFFFHASH